jgi:hypothetical protein
VGAAHTQSGYLSVDLFTTMGTFMLWDMLSQNNVQMANWKAREAQDTATAAISVGRVLQHDTVKLSLQVERLTLAAMAMAELLRDKLGVSEAEIEAKMTEIDLRDGQQDGRFRPAPIPCEKCESLNAAGRPCCLYCGHELDESSFLFQAGDDRQLDDEQ